MARPEDPTEAIRRKAVTFPRVAKGTSCTQSAFKAGTGTFLFIGPGPKGQGFKAMFKRNTSMPQALKLAAENPERFEVGSTGWVTARFTAEEPLPKRIWEKWLAESHDVTCGAGRKAKKGK
ncbi:hypothetical protein K8I85_05140 [bacterium]|nr:hypothetical protein [bacterium]